MAKAAVHAQFKHGIQQCMLNLSMACVRTCAAPDLRIAALFAFHKRPTIKSATVPQSAAGESDLRPQMRLYGHRGASSSRPENTLAAFAYALDRGAAGVECDTHAMRDGIVVLHDRTLQRTGLHPSKDEILHRNIKDMTMDEVSDVDIGSWKGSEFAEERAPSYEAFLALVAAKHGSCLVELKNHCVRSVQRMAAVTRLSGLDPEQVVFISFDLGLASAMKASAPEYKCFGIAEIMPCGIRWLDKWRALAFAWRCKAAGLDGVDYNADTRLVTPELVSDVRAQGLKCAVWVSAAPAANDVPEVWKAMDAAGVEIFTSNCPEEAFSWWGSLQPSE